MNNSTVINFGLSIEIDYVRDCKCEGRDDKKVLNDKRHSHGGCSDSFAQDRRGCGMVCEILQRGLTGKERLAPLRIHAGLSFGHHSMDEFSYLPRSLLCAWYSADQTPL